MLLNCDRKLQRQIERVSFEVRVVVWSQKQGRDNFLTNIKPKTVIHLVRVYHE